MAIKCFPISDVDHTAKIFGKALKEFCLFKIASGLGVGPKLKKQGGFDIVFYPKCVEFGMEKCIELS